MVRWLDGCRLFFRNVIQGDVFLSARFEAPRFISSQPSVFGCPPLHAGAPFFPVAQVHLVLHDADHFRFGDAKLGFDGVEGRAVLPCHFHNAVEVAVGELVLLKYFFDVHTPV